MQGRVFLEAKDARLSVAKNLDFWNSKLLLKASPQHPKVEAVVAFLHT